MQSPAVEYLIDAGAALRDLGSKHWEGPLGHALATAVFTVGQAIYGHNSGSLKAQREGTRVALRIVVRARKMAGAPEGLGAVAVKLGAALRHLK